MAETPLGLCTVHHDRYHVAGRPGGAALPDMWAQRLERCGLPIPVSYEDETAFRQWCRTAPPVTRAGEINLRGVRPLARAELKPCTRHGDRTGERVRALCPSS